MDAPAFLTRLTILAASLLCLARTEVLAQSAAPQTPAAKPEMTESCPGLVASERPAVVPAAIGPGQLSVISGLAAGVWGASDCARTSVRARQSKLAARIVSRVKKAGASMERFP